VETQQAARHLEATLLQRLEVERIGEKTVRKPTENKVPAGRSYTLREEDKEQEEEVSDETEEDEEAVDAILPGGGDAGSDELLDLHGSPYVGPKERNRSYLFAMRLNN
jgi:hypothetical protein